MSSDVHFAHNYCPFPCFEWLHSNSAAIEGIDPSYCSYSYVQIVANLETKLHCTLWTCPIVVIHNIFLPSLPGWLEQNPLNTASTVLTWLATLLTDISSRAIRTETIIGIIRGLESRHLLQ